jgi:hypothetical protein
MKIVASLTTMPNRIDLIRTTLNSVSNQNVAIDHIEINVPYKCIRTGEDYIIPEWLENYPNLQIHRTEDYGAITKVAPTLIRYKDDEETYIWSVDDDVDYTDNTLSVLLRQHDPSIKRILAYSVGGLSNKGFSGNIARADYGVFLEGFATVLYPPLSIGDDFLSYVETTSAFPDCKVSDDVTLSNYFYGRGIRPFCCPENKTDNLKVCKNLLPYYKDATATHLQSGGHFCRYVRVLHTLKELGLLYWTTELPPIKPPVVKTNPTEKVLAKPVVKNSPPQKESTTPTVSASRSQAIDKPLSPVNQVKHAIIEPKQGINFALTGSSQRSGRRFWG